MYILKKAYSSFIISIILLIIIDKLIKKGLIKLEEIRLIK